MIIKPHELLSKRKTGNTVINMGDGILFGNKRTVMIAGPCAIESEEQIMETAEFLCNRGVKVFRAGAFKPRTSPYHFMGMGYDGLKILERVKKEYGMLIITEVKDLTHINEVIDVADIIQVGSKAMYHLELLSQCGKENKPILLKRGFMATIKEFLQAADAILCKGNNKVILCERGIRTFEPQTRFTLDVCSAALLKEISHLPIVLDPSHAMGLNRQVPEVAQAAVGLGIDGIMIEVHPNPEEALCDKEQALSFTQFEELLPRLEHICDAVGRRMV